ncbi:hypothetical protein BDY19DRAFT_951179 [Irpex rosettiformis]|uniref:Uncharacterized protein n=1 Tax=Irpex rosettiformis TaxID=378272 RepID=A0ACB8U0S0_9APHY|nr:hypothetical protein BDY19DRAFT_951179 [Irpex rosettiformis]
MEIERALDSHQRGMLDLSVISRAEGSSSQSACPFRSPMLLFRRNRAVAACVLLGFVALNSVGAATACGHHNAQDDGDDNDDDGEDSDNSSSRSSRQHGTATGTQSSSSNACSESSSSIPQLGGSRTHHGISKGAIAGIVIALFCHWQYLLF